MYQGEYKCNDLIKHKEHGGIAQFMWWDDGEATINFKGAFRQVNWKYLREYWHPMEGDISD